MKNTDVCLINMPYSSLERPSLALGIIKKYIAKFDHSVEVIYGTLEFAKHIGIRNYYLVDNSNHEDMLGEWTFSKVAFPNMKQNDPAFFKLFPNLPNSIIKRLMIVRDQADQFILQLADKILIKNPKIVGCTSTFQQNCASLALLRIIKEKNPNIITLMGGANCEGKMGQTISNNFQWVDYVFSGECDTVIGPFVHELINGNCSNSTLPKGILTPQSNDIESLLKKPERAVVNDMRLVESPDYSSYFTTLDQLELVDEIEPGLIVETSRGCWWGAKKHCTFCGLNGGGMEHRSKSHQTVINEWNELSSTYHINKIEVVDNILPNEYFKTLLPKLSTLENKYSIFYETKANLKQEHVKLLSNAGVKWIQPGFESLHDDFLKMIRKGVTAVQNVAALKWCREFGVRLSWNILCNAPGEKQEWYNEMAEWLPLISHLQPPQQYMIKIRYQRFSPYFNNASDYNLKLSPLRSYGFIYPLEGQDLFDIGYFFEGVSEDGSADYNLESANEFTEIGHAALQNKIIDWFQSFWKKSSPPLLCMIDNGTTIRILDTRKVATNFSLELKGINAITYRLCSSPIMKKQLLKKLNENHQLNIEALEEILEELIDKKILLYLSGRYLALALEGEVPILPTYLDYPGGTLSFLKPKVTHINSSIKTALAY